MLPASDLSEIITNLAALNLQPNTAAQILAAVLAPLLRSSADPELGDLPGNPKRPYKRAGRPRLRARKAPRQKKRRVPRPRDARERAIAALRAHPGETVSAVAKTAGVSRSTVVNASKDLATEARKEARRKSRATPNTAKPTDRRQRAQQFLRDELARGPKRISDVEDAAAKAHIDEVSLSRARSDLGIVATRANTGGVHAVQWSLPG